MCLVSLLVPSVLTPAGGKWPQARSDVQVALHHWCFAIIVWNVCVLFSVYSMLLQHRVGGPKAPGSRYGYLSSVIGIPGEVRALLVKHCNTEACRFTWGSRIDLSLSYTAMVYMSAAAHCSGWRQLCVFVRAQPSMQGSCDAACLLCVLGAVCSYFSVV
jgi:hypothetical protein